MAGLGIVEGEIGRLERHIQASHAGTNIGDGAVTMPKAPVSESKEGGPRRHWQRKKKQIASNLLKKDQIPPYDGRIEWDIGGMDKARPAEWIVWTLTATDPSGNKLDPPGADEETQALHAELAFDDPVRGLMILDGNIERVEKGVYNFHFYTLTLGVYALKLLYGPNRLFKSANITTEIVKSDELVDEAEALNFLIQGVNLKAVHVGQVVPLDLYVSNLQNEAVQPDENLLSIRVFGDGRWQTMKLFPKDAGHYQIMMQESAAGIFSVKVKYAGIEVTSTKLEYFEPTVAEKSVLINPPKGRIKVGEKQMFKIQAKDGLGRLVGPVNDEWTFGVFASNELPVDVKITDNRDGTHTCEFVLPDIGDYTVRCTIKGKESGEEVQQHCKGSPFKLVGYN